jgi:HAD superfamily hydrolase (TIGR01490 family)
MADKITLAIFDFDGTLSTGHLWLGIAQHHKAHKIKRISLYTYLLSHMPFWFAAKLKLYNDDKNRARWGEDLPVLFKGFTSTEAHQAFVWVIENYFMPLMRPDVVQILQDHKKQGHKIILLSGMFVTFLELIGQRMGIDYVVGTKLEIINGVYSGRIVRPLCFGENKAKLLNEFLRQQRLDVDFSSSFAYADGIYDAPVFNLVGHPIATYPDEKLTGLAIARKWPILGTTRTKD